MTLCPKCLPFYQSEIVPHWDKNRKAVQCRRCRYEREEKP